MRIKQTHSDSPSPAAPDLGRREHAAPTTHVSKRTLTSTLGSATLDTRDTRHSTPSSPRLGRGLESEEDTEKTHRHELLILTVRAFASNPSNEVMRTRLVICVSILGVRCILVEHEPDV